MRKHFYWLLFALTACGGGSDAPELYTLRAPVESMNYCRNAGKSIAVTEPVAAPGLDSSRMVVREAAHHQTFYQGVRWNAPVPQVLQHYMVERLQNSGLFTSATTEDSAMRQAWLLEMQLHEFSVDKTAARAVIRLTISIVNTAERTPLFTDNFQFSEPIDGQSIDQIVATFNRGLDRISTDMLNRIRAKLPACR